MKKYKKWNRRQWLNPVRSHDMGAIQLSVDADEYGVDGYVTVWDCDRKITLDFCHSTHKEHNERMAKLDNILLQLNTFRTELEYAYSHAEAAIAERKEKEKKAREDRKNGKENPTLPGISFME